MTPTEWPAVSPKPPMTRTEALARLVSCGRGLVIAVVYGILLFGLVAVAVAM